jgi:hypothetical protein
VYKVRSATICPKTSRFPQMAHARNDKLLGESWDWKHFHHIITSSCSSAMTDLDVAAQPAHYGPADGGKNAMQVNSIAQSCRVSYDLLLVSRPLGNSPRIGGEARSRCPVSSVLCVQYLPR